MKWGQRGFDLLLRLFPQAFRARHGEAMREAFQAGCEERRGKGPVSLGAFLFRTFLDLVVSGVRERVASSVAPSRPPAPGGFRARGGIVSLLDVKLGIRMLGKYPGLTLVSTLALAVGIPVGLAPSHFVDGLMAPLPVPRGEEIRALRLWSPAMGRAAFLTSYDYETWRPALSTFEDIAAFQESSYNVDPGDGSGAPVRGASVTASAFEILRVPALLGRTLQAADQAPGAEDVVVLGYALWQSRYLGDPSIIGRTIRLGSAPHTVVGVMPEGFLFPKRQDLWTPLRLPVGHQSETAVPVEIFGRLARGITPGQAEAEFALVSRRSAQPERDPRIQAGVEPFAYTLLPGLSGGIRGTPEFLGFQTLAVLVLLVACVNVGLLIFARTANRADEIAVRTALGAGRARIVAQIFVECLVLALLATGAGLMLMQLVFDGMWRFLPASWSAALPFWIDWKITGTTGVHALVLAAASAVVAGVVPALRVTGGPVQSNIQRASAGRSGVRFGGLSSVLIVLDVAVAVTAVGFARSTADAVRFTDISDEAVGIPATEYLAATIRLPTADRADSQEELVRRLKAEPGVRAVAVANSLPRMQHGTVLVEAEGIELPDGRTGMSTRLARADLDFFDELGQPILAGRGFDVGDLEGARTSVMVNTTFVERVFGGQNAVGRRVRFRPWGDGEPGPWMEIVGVVGHLGMRIINPDGDQGLYLPLAPGDMSEIRMAIHIGDDPTSFVPRLRALAGDVDPDAMVSILGPLDEQYEGDYYILMAASMGAALLVGVLLALASSGIYALLSHSVALRTREIGIRAALGADRKQLIRSVVSRSLSQLGLGVLLGMPMAALILGAGTRTIFSGAAGAAAFGLAVLFLVAGAACTGPTLRALRIQPTDALREG
jgi:putative ABC transport system permease protein